MRHLFYIIHFIRAVVVGFAILFALCVLALAIAEDMPLGDAVYLVLITATTVGYGDITPTTVWGKTASVAAGLLGLLASGIVVAVAVRALALSVHERLEEHKPKGENSGAERRISKG
jgi:voltage-gated potassium channel